MKPHERTLGEKLQQNCEGLKVLLIDEKSMIGATTLGWMEFMCRYGVKNGENLEILQPFCLTRCYLILSNC
jgi:predicted deacylase